MKDQQQTPAADRSLREDFGWELSLLRQESEALPAELQALEARLRAAQREPPPPLWLLGRAPAWGALTLVAAAAAAVALVVGGGAGETGETALELASPEWTTAQVHPDVQLHFEGSGHHQSRARVHEIDWRQGRLQVSVTPQQDITLSVKTEEAVVSVVGTVFDVSRDRYGTTVSVSAGRVQVVCVGRAPVFLTAADGPQVCMTQDPNALVERTREQLAGGDTAGALQTAAEGLRVAEAGSYAAAQLHTYRAEVLLSSDTAAALSAAESALATGQPALEVRARRAAIAAALQGAGGCAVAEPHLGALVAGEAAAPAAGFHELALLADCVQATNPDRARALWTQALQVADSDDQRADVRRRLADLE